MGCTDCQFSEPTNKHLAGKQFATDTDVKQAVTSWQQTLDNDLHYTGVQAFLSWWDKCLNISGDFEKT
jgi:hypothetical protein